MHETVIARNIIETAMQQGDVSAVTLEIGELAHVPAEELIACIKAQVSWNIMYTIKPARVRCSCGFSGHPTVLEHGHDFFLIECPRCKNVPDVIDGTNVKLINVEVC